MSFYVDVIALALLLITTYFLLSPAYLSHTYVALASFSLLENPPSDSAKDAQNRPHENPEGCRVQSEEHKCSSERWSCIASFPERLQICTKEIKLLVESSTAIGIMTQVSYVISRPFP